MTDIQFVAIFIYLGLIFTAVKPVIHQLKQTKVQHLVFGSAASVAILWWFRTGIYAGLDVHFLWLTALTLIMGWRWAIFSSFLAICILASFNMQNWQDIGVYGLIGCVTPILFSFFTYMLAYHKLPRHFFVYIFFCGFFTGTCSIALKMALFGWYYNTIDLYNWTVITDNYLILIPLLLFPEGLLNGMTMTLLVIYKPTWVATFYDNQYLQGK